MAHGSYWLRPAGAALAGAFLLAGCMPDWWNLPQLPPATLPAEPPPPLPVRGVNLIGFSSSEYVAPEARLAASLGDFAALGGNWVAVNFWWFQDHAAASAIAPDPQRYTISDAALEAAVQTAHAQGLRVLLRPVVDLRDGGWRGTIQPSAAWFATYREFILRYAALAAEWDVAAFSVGVELSGTETWRASWRALITEVRAVYTGPVTYCANYDAAERLAWWDAVDIIGIDAYYAVATQPGVDVAGMTAAWQYWLARVQATIVAAHPGQPVWLTEVGVQAARGAARRPECFSGTCGGLVELEVVDLDEQANYYRATLLAAGQYSWLGGVFWWSWYADPAAPYLRQQDYSPQGKPAQAVLAEFWGRRDQ